MYTGQLRARTLFVWVLAPQHAVLRGPDSGRLAAAVSVRIPDGGNKDGELLCLSLRLRRGRSRYCSRRRVRVQCLSSTLSTTLCFVTKQGAAGHQTPAPSNKLQLRLRCCCR